MRTQYTLPDGRLLDVGAERALIGECVFAPWLMQRELLGIHQLVYKAIMAADVDMRKDLFGNVVLYGGTTMLPNFAARLARGERGALVVEINLFTPALLFIELTNLAPPSIRVRVM